MRSTPRAVANAARRVWIRHTSACLRAIGDKVVPGQERGYRLDMKIDPKTRLLGWPLFAVGQLLIALLGATLHNWPLALVPLGVAAGAMALWRSEWLKLQRSRAPA